MWIHYTEEKNEEIVFQYSKAIMLKRIHSHCCQTSEVAIYIYLHCFLCLISVNKNINQQPCGSHTLIVNCNYRLASDTWALRKQTEAFCENQLAIWNLQSRVLNILLLFINCMLPILYISKFYNKLRWVYTHIISSTFTSILLPEMEDLRALSLCWKLS